MGKLLLLAECLDLNYLTHISCVGPDEGSTQSEAAPVANGGTQESEQADQDGAKSALSHEDFATNNNLPDSSPSKAAPDGSPAEGTETAKVNGTADVDEKQSEEKLGNTTVVQTSSTKTLEAADKADNEATMPTDAPPAEPKDTKKDYSADGPIPGSNGDAMDIDTSTDLLAPVSSAKPADATLNTSTESGPPVASSPLGSSQAADLSRLEIKGTEEEEGISPTQKDMPMIDSIASPVKVPREREEDDAEEPAAKRAKTEDTGEAAADSLVVASNIGAGTSTSAGEAGGLESAIPDSLPILSHQNRKTRDVLGNVKKTKNGGNFRKSVRELWPALWDDYVAKVDNPMDISLMEAKLREDKYANYGEFKADVKQLYENAVIFNGPHHDVTRAAAQVRDYILVRMPEIIHAKAPVKPEKGKAQPTRHTEPRAATQPRRQSHPQTQALATSPKPKTEPLPLALAATPTAQAFAIPPSGIPQIRRDSTREDHDRPKRPIHPPKNRDPEYASKASRKKKLVPEQRFFDMVLEELKKHKYYPMNQWFLTPVDPVALNIPNYFKVIKKPMDLASMTEKNYDGEYKTTKDLERDMKLIVHNSEIFNGPDHEVSTYARQLEELLKNQLAGKDKWMERHYPSAAPSAMRASAASPERSIGESDDDSEDDGQEEDDGAIHSLQLRLNEEQEKLNQLLNSKKPDLTMMEVQQSMVTFLQRKLVEERTKFHSEKKPKKKKSAGSKSKPKAGGASSLGGNKRLSGSVSTSKKPANNSKKPPAPKKRLIGALEKAVIAEGINELDGNTLTKAVDIIKRDTGQNVSTQPQSASLPMSTVCSRQHVSTMAWEDVKASTDFFSRRMMREKWSWT